MFSKGLIEQKDWQGYHHTESTMQGKEVSASMKPCYLQLMILTFVEKSKTQEIGTQGQTLVEFPF